uniref:Uncharacterized protein n=1 Tax=Anguilla anguilla TaxID=7936 RepID=A0A0E9WDL0_ANGAN
MLEILRECSSFTMFIKYDVQCKIIIINNDAISMQQSLANGSMGSELLPWVSKWPSPSFLVRRGTGKCQMATYPARQKAHTESHCYLGKPKIKLEISDKKKRVLPYSWWSLWHRYSQITVTKFSIYTV